MGYLLMKPQAEQLERRDTPTTTAWLDADGVLQVHSDTCSVYGVQRLDATGQPIFTVGDKDTPAVWVGPTPGQQNWDVHPIDIGQWVGWTADHPGPCGTGAVMTAPTGTTAGTSGTSPTGTGTTGTSSDPEPAQGAKAIGGGLYTSAGAINVDKHHGKRHEKRHDHDHGHHKHHAAIDADSGGKKEGK